MAQPQAINPKSVQGWGADLEVRNRPAYPKERTPPRFIHPHWASLEQQPVTVKVYHSIERPSITPVFGTSTPPVGLSEKIRDLAFRLSESDIRHWLLLLFADRVNVVEGIFFDLASGHIPNIFAEMGARAEFKYNRAGFIRKSVVAVGVVGLVSFWLVNRNRSRNQNRIAAQT